MKTREGEGGREERREDEGGREGGVSALFFAGQGGELTVVGGKGVITLLEGEREGMR